jgi:2-polyprenyl-6-methoxyphenol hydroxylase-like FAD-dependent oxidoreductase
MRALPLLQRLLADATFCEDSVRLVRNYSYRSNRVAGPGFFLLGDAAGFVDPIFSVGVVFGMYSAYAAAHHDRPVFSPARQARRASIDFLVAGAGETGAQPIARAALLPGDRLRACESPRGDGIQ